ncbi:MAG: hypothetical protein WC238_04410 [Parcubacteria group bacterium]|jgi:hypothetical protein
MEKQTKILLFIGSILIIIAIVFFISTRTKNTTPSITTQPISSPIAFTIPSSNDQKMKINTPSGDIETNNVYRESSEKLSLNGVSFQNNTDYSMSFYPNDKAFLIVIKNPDVKAARDKAEVELLKNLDITRETACRLTVITTIPFNINPHLSGKEYGLSFCPGAKTF